MLFSEVLVCQWPGQKQISPSRSHLVVTGTSGVSTRGTEPWVYSWQILQQVRSGLRVTCCLSSFLVTEHSIVPGESVWYWGPGTVLQAPRSCIPSWSLSSHYIGQGKHEGSHTMNLYSFKHRNDGAYLVTIKSWYHSFCNDYEFYRLSVVDLVLNS
jgi:hypothetical protein